MGKIKTSILIVAFITLAFSCQVFASTPQGVKQTNIRNNQFTISWITVVSEAGSVNYGTTPALGNTQQDDKGSGISTDTHYVTVNPLQPNRLYYYDIVSGGVTYNNGGAHYTVTTGPILDPPIGSDFAYGRIYMPDSSPAAGAVVYLNLSDNNGIGTSGISQDASASVDSNGWWSYILVNLRTPDLSAYFQYSLSGDNEILTAKKGMNDSVTQTIDTSNDRPAPIMTLGWTLNMIDMQWRQKESYSSAACCEMILDYIREGLASDLSQTDIYNHAHPAPDSQEMTADEVDLALGHFDPYDTIVSNWSDYYDSVADGNPYQGYNYTVDTYDPAQPDAMNEYMRDIAHWMAYTVTKEYWWGNGELVQKPNTPAAIPIFGDTLGYNHWIVVKGVATNTNPLPEPHVNPWNTPDFTVYGFWIKDPDISGIGQNSYKTAAECSSTYFKPLNTDDKYDGLYLQVAEPAEVDSDGCARIIKPLKELANLEFIGVRPFSLLKKIRKQSWKDLVDPHILADSEAVAAFDGTRMGKPILVHRLDLENADYYLVPFNKVVKKRGLLTSAVIILDAKGGYFREATWTNKPEKYLRINEGMAKALVLREIIRSHRDYIRYYKGMKCQLVWEPGELSTSPYQPFWQVTVGRNIWHVTQDGTVTQQE